MSYIERTEMLLGREAVNKLKNCHVAVFGLGGVGGHAISALSRSGIGKLTLIDNDEVSVTNINRQLPATLATVGMKKTEAARLMIEAVRDDCEITLREEFVLPENIDAFDFSLYDYVIDAIDTVSAKIAIIKACDRVGTPVISAMGAGNKLDPTKFEVSDIYKTSVCPLAAAVRRELRKSGVKRCKVVYSREEAVVPEFIPGEKCENGENSEEKAYKKRIPASAAFVPSVCGLIIASEVIKDLSAEEISRSLELRRDKTSAENTSNT